MTTYILGAGASVHAGYPLSSELWRALLNCADESFRDQITGLGLPEAANIENLLSDLEVAGGAFERTEPDQRARIGWGIRSLIAKYFGAIHRDNPNAELYRGLAERLQDGDVVVSFNYDLAFERQATNIGRMRLSDGYGFTTGWNEPPSPTKLLKPHGSLNWRAHLFGGAQGAIRSGSLGSQPIVDNNGYELPVYPRRVIQGGFPGGGVTDETVSMILPSRRKSYNVPTSLGPEWNGLYNELFRQAEEALKISQRVVQIGYSMPEADDRIRASVFSSIRDDASIELYCGDGNARLCAEFRDRDFRNVRSGGRFEDFLKRGPASV